MEIAGIEEIGLPCCDPALASLRLTLGAVAIATRVVGDGLIPAALTGIAMPAEGSGGGSAEWLARLSAAGSPGSIDSGRESSGLGRGGCQPPSRQAESWVLFTVVLTVNFLDARKWQSFQGIGDGP